MEKKKTKVAIAMSGGVDSSVAAKILVDQGFEVVGFMMKLWSDPDSCSSRENACCDAQGVMDAKKVADQLGIPFYLVNAKEIFKKEVTDYFLNEYKNLRTPNPCVVCNEKIKFGWLLDFAKKTGCDYLATGHYARIIADNSKKQDTRNKIQTNNNLSNSNIQTQSNTDCHSEAIAEESQRSFAGYTQDDKEEKRNDNIVYHLLCGADEKKDQTYFLHRFTQDQLASVMFPVGEYTKDEVRVMAKEWKLSVFEKRESQEICFINDKDFRQFLKRNIPVKYFKPGDIVDKEGNVIGKHEGLINYTIGQRKGIDQLSVVSCQLSEKQPLYVIGFDVAKNQLMVGEDKEVYRNEMIVKDLHFIQNTDNRIQITENLKVKIRYRHPAVDCKIVPARHPGLDPGSRNYCIDSGSQVTGRNDKFVVQFDQPQRAITPGQSAVFYDGDEVLGGGTIQ